MRMADGAGHREWSREVGDVHIYALLVPVFGYRRERGLAGGGEGWVLVAILVDV